METEDRGLNSGDQQQTDHQTGADTTSNDTSGKSGNPKPKRPRKRSTTTQTTGSDQSGKEKETNPPDPVLINEQIPVVKSKPRSHKKIIKPDIKEIAENMAYFIQGIFTLVAGRAGEHWNINYDEALKVATPAARILDRLDLSEKVSAYSDYMALAAAIFSIVVPRIIFEAAENKNKREVPQIVYTDQGPAESNGAKTQSENQTASYGGGGFTDVLDAIIGG